MTEVDDVAFARSASSFLSGGTRCAADVYRPEGSTGPTPVVVMAHGFGSPRALGLPPYAERFAAAGYVVVVFDYRSFGDSDGEPRQVLDIDAQLADWRAAVAWARTLDGVDSGRVVGWGTSFAGGHVLTLAGTGENFAAVIAQVPHVSGLAAVRATGLRQSLRLLPAALTDVFRATTGRDPRYVPLVGAPGTVAAIATPDAEAGVERMIGASGRSRTDYPEIVAARVLLRVGTYSPNRHAKRIDAPTLIQVAADDTIAFAGSAAAMARQITTSTFTSYRGGHFDPYVTPLFDSVIADQIEFLRTHVPLRS